MGFQLTPVILEAYWRVIGPRMTTEQFETAFDKLLTTSKFFPKPTEILEAVQGNLQDASEIAWLALNRAIDDVGGYRSPKFADGVLTATVEALGGWQFICGIKASEFESFFRNNFIKTYQSFLKTGTTSDRPLVGIHDQQNGRRGGQVLIGELATGLVPEQKRIEQW